jgi:hypothetical protein
LDEYLQEYQLVIAPLENRLLAQTMQLHPIKAAFLRIARRGLWELFD